MTPITTGRLISTADVRRALIERREIALLDVRDEASFAEAHPLFAASLPLDRVAGEVLGPHPAPHDAASSCTTTAKGSSRARFEQLRALGYTDVAALDGGLDGWRRAGGELFRDVNVPSKAFGELVEAHAPHAVACRPRSSRRCSTRTPMSSCSTRAASTNTRR